MLHALFSASCELGFSGRRQQLGLDGKVCASVDVRSEVPQGSVLQPLLFMLHTTELFHIVKNHIVCYTIDTTIYAVIPIQISRPQSMESGFGSKPPLLFELPPEAQSLRPVYMRH